MKKYLIFLILILFAFVINKANAYDPVDPCVAHYPDVSYVGPSYFTIESSDCPGCFYTIEYWKRKDLSWGFREIQITKIINISGANCDNCTFDQIYQQAMSLLWEQNLVYFEMNNGGFFNGCYASLAACWEKYHEDNTNPGIINKDDNLQAGGPPNAYKPCSGATCCYVTYDITVDEEGLAEIYCWNYTFHQGTCPPESDPDCKPECDALLFNWERTMFKLNDNSPAIIRPNPSEGIFELSFNSTYTGKIQVSITDISGEIMKSWSFDKTSEYFNTNLDLSNLINRSYYLIIEGDGKILKKSMLNTSK